MFLWSCLIWINHMKAIKQRLPFTGWLEQKLSIKPLRPENMKQDWNKTDDCTQNSASPPLQRARLCVCTWVLCMSSARSRRRQCILQLIQLQIFTLPRGRQWCSCQPMSVSVCCCRFRGSDRRLTWICEVVYTTNVAQSPSVSRCDKDCLHYTAVHIYSSLIVLLLTSLFQCVKAPSCFNTDKKCFTQKKHPVKVHLSLKQSPAVSETDYRHLK